MPFGGEYGWEGRGRCYLNASSSHQCLSAGSTVGRLRIRRSSKLLLIVTNAFRRGVRLGGVPDCLRRLEELVVTNAFRRGVRLGVTRPEAVECGESRVTNAFRRGVRLGEGRRKLLIRKPRDPD